jgi:hypothetical protein
MKNLKLIGVDGATERLLQDLADAGRYSMEELIEEIFHTSVQIGGETYDRTNISIHNIGFGQGYDTQLEQAAKQLGLPTQNTGEHLDDTGFLGNISRDPDLNDPDLNDPAVELAKQLGYHAPAIVHMKDLLRTVIAGIDYDQQGYDGEGNEIRDQGILIATRDDILKQANPYRGSWLTDRFELEEGRLTHIYTVFKDGELEEIREPLDETTLMEDRLIDLGGWLRNPKILPQEGISSGDLTYWYPRDKSVARFDANAYGVVLSCDAYPRDSSSGLGVRACARAEN